MKILQILAVVALISIQSIAQSKPTTAGEYNSKFDYAVSATNAAFPFVFTVVVERFSEGKSVFLETMIDERQSAIVERITKTTVRDGKSSVVYQVRPELGKIYCSNDGVKWEGPQQYECSGAMLSRPNQPESSEYSMEDKVVDGKAVKVYSERLVYPAAPGREKKTFKDTLATIDSRGFFISITNKEGTLDPEVVWLTRKQTWDFKTQIKPITAPK